LTMTTAVRPLRHTRDPDPEETLFGSGARVEAVTVPRLGAGVAQGEDIDLDGGTRADRQRVRRSEMSADIIAEKRIREVG